MLQHTMSLISSSPKVWGICGKDVGKFKLGGGVQVCQDLLAHGLSTINVNLNQPRKSFGAFANKRSQAPLLALSSSNITYTVGLEEIFGPKTFLLKTTLEQIVLLEK